MNTNREEREAAVLAEIEADRNARRLASKARESENTLLFIVVALIAAFLVGFGFLHSPEAHGASRPVFKGTVTICISPSKKSDPYGQYVNTMWDVSAAAKAAGVGSVRVVKDRYPRDTCYGDVYVGSDTSSRSSRVYKLVDGGQLWESQVTMGDRWGRTHTAAQRKAELVKALKTAIPR